ncbi:MAG: BamA/TamA family outer membrane protein [bacterium]
MFRLILIPLFLVGMLSNAFDVSAQQKYMLELNRVDKGSIAEHDIIVRTREFSDKEECVQYLQKQLLPLLQKKGYLAASVDTMLIGEQRASASIYLGDRYEWGEIIVDSTVLAIIKFQQLDWGNTSGTPLSIESVVDTKEQLLQVLEEQGYPFAAVRLDSSYFREHKLYARLTADLGPLYHIDSIHVQGKLRIKQEYLQRYLGIGGGDVYKKSKLDAVSVRLASLNFLKESKPWDMQLLGTGSVLNLYLEPKQSNRFNLLAGLMPSNQQVGGKLRLTGEAELDLKNTFGGAENLFLSWQQIQVQSPRLQVGFQKPYLFNTNAGVDFSFNLLKKDSSFITLNTSIGIIYEINPRQRAKIFFQQFSSNLIDVDTNRVRQTKRLPAYLDVRTSAIGVDLNYSGTDNKFNPTKGLELTFRLTGGVRRLLKNNAIMRMKSDVLGGSFDYSSLYDTVRSSTSQFRLTAKADLFNKIGRQATIKTGLQGGWINGRNLLLNELYQVGGIKTLRGFDEESLFTSEYLIATVEYRYLVGQNSYLFSFVDGAYAGQRGTVQAANRLFAGAGLGLSFETRSGVFSLAYAVGKRSTEPINFRESKIHFGFVSLF